MSAFTVRDGVLYRDGVEATDADALEICRELSPAIQKFVPNKPKMFESPLWLWALVGIAPVFAGRFARITVDSFDGGGGVTSAIAITFGAFAIAHDIYRSRKAKRVRA